MKTFVESQFEVMLVCKFQTKANSYEDICWASLWSYVSLWVSKKSEFLWRHLFILSLKLFKLMSFKEKRLLVNKFVESQFEVVYVYEFPTKASFYVHICWVSVWSYLSLRVSNKTEFLWTYFFSLSLTLCKFVSFKQNWTLMKTFLESQFEIM